MADVFYNTPLDVDIKRYAGNKLLLAITQKVVEHQDTKLEAFYREKLQKAMGISANKLSLLLNNFSQLSLEDAFHAAQVLEIKIEDLVKYS